MKLSIYIPALTRDALFDRCLRSIERSVAAAGADALDHEIVVVEGVSPLAEARNEGLRRTTGDWIATVDADDEVEEAWFGEICRAIRVAEEPGSEIDDIVFDLTSVRHGRCFPRCLNREKTFSGQTLSDDLLRDMRIGNHCVLHVTSRRLWEGERFEPVRILEDFMTMPRIVRKARKVLYVPNPLYRYYEREGSLCTSSGLAEFFALAVERARRLGRTAAIGACVAAFNCLYDREDRTGAARRWIRRHMVQAICDREVPAKWKLKFLLASFGIVIRRPK